MKINKVIKKLTKIQIKLMNKIENQDYNDITEMIGEIKERLANIKK